MKKYLLAALLFLSGTAGFCTTWTVNNAGFTFSPASVTIDAGDSVQFSLASMHNALEVSEETWIAKGNTPLPGGFETAFGGGLVLPLQLSVGTHYYVCSPHASSGMRGIIIVQSLTGVDDLKAGSDFFVYPNPARSIMTIKANENMIGKQFYMTDQSGRKVFDGRVTSNETQVNIGQLATGTYQVILIDQKKQAYKLIKN